jgi:hypothetical protein
MILSKFNNAKDIYPVEQISVCREHYNDVARHFDYQVNEVNSSMPEIWCNSCNNIN